MKKNCNTVFSKQALLGKSIFILAFTSIIVLTIGVSCKDKNPEPEPEFDKTQILTSVADNNLLPGFLDLKNQTTDLKTLIQNYIAGSQTTTDFDAIQSKWKDVARSFQRVRVFDFGPSMDAGFNMKFGVFPCDTSIVENNISAGTYDLSLTANQNAIGLDALDYLLFRSNAKAQADANSAVWSYILALVSKMETEVSSVYTQFQAYRSTFINGTGTSSTSPFSLLVNAFTREFELTKNTKIGIPIGNLTLGIVQKGYIENRRSGIANELLVVNLETLQSIFKGTNTTNGFEDYLNEIEKSDLASTINSRFSYLISTGAAWTETIDTKIDSSLPELTSYYDYMQGTVVYLKTDMPSSFGVLITYQDNDGD